MLHRCGKGLVVAALAGAALAANLRGETGGSYRRSVAEIEAAQTAADGMPAPRLAAPRLVSPRALLPSNADSPAETASVAGAAPVAPPGPSAPQTLGVSFLAATSAETNAFPPDTMGAAGPTQFLVALNGRIRTFLKSSGAADGVLNVATDTFFDSVRNGQSTAYPRVRFDRLSGRWIVTVMNFNVTPASNRILIAVSDAGVITAGTTWTYFFFQHDLDSPAGDTALFLDYPTLGVDANGLTIGGNIFDSARRLPGHLRARRSPQPASRRSGRRPRDRGRRRRVPQSHRHPDGRGSLHAAGRGQPRRPPRRPSRGSRASTTRASES